MNVKINGLIAARHILVARLQYIQLLDASAEPAAFTHHSGPAYLPAFYRQPIWAPLHWPAESSRRRYTTTPPSTGARGNPARKQQRVAGTVVLQ